MVGTRGLVLVKFKRCTECRVPFPHGRLLANGKEELPVMVLSVEGGKYLVSHFDELAPETERLAGEMREAGLAESLGDAGEEAQRQSIKNQIDEYIVSALLQSFSSGEPEKPGR